MFSTHVVVPDKSSAPVGVKPDRSRRLSDKILGAFHQALDQSDFETGLQLLDVLQNLLDRPARPHDRRLEHEIKGLVAGHERLWLLRRAKTEPAASLMRMEA